MKKFVLLLLALIMGVFAFAKFADYPYCAKVVNVSSSLNIRQKGSTKSTIVGKVERGDTVRCQLSAAELSGSSDWVRVRHGSIEGYVKANYLTSVVVASPAPTKTNAQASGGFVKGIGDYKFYIMLVLAIIMFVLASRHDHSYEMVMLMLGFFVLMLLAAWFFIGSDFRDGRHVNGLDIFESGGKYWFSRGINIIILGVYMCTLVVGYLATCYGIADIATDTQEDYEATSVSFFLWLSPLLVVCLFFPVAIVVVAPLALWKFGLNCKLMWPKVHYPLIILVLGIATCLMIFYLFLSIITQLLVVGFFTILIIAVLKGSESNLSFSSSSNSRVGDRFLIHEAANGDPWTTDANGNMISLKKDEHSETPYSDSNGHYYDKNGYRLG